MSSPRPQAGMQQNTDIPQSTGQQSEEPVPSTSAVPPLAQEGLDGAGPNMPQDPLSGATFTIPTSAEQYPPLPNAFCPPHFHFAMPQFTWNNATGPTCFPSMQTPTMSALQPAGTFFFGIPFLPVLPIGFFHQTLATTALPQQRTQVPQPHVAAPTQRTEDPLWVPGPTSRRESPVWVQSPTSTRESPVWVPSPPRTRASPAWVSGPPIRRENSLWVPGPTSRRESPVWMPAYNNRRESPLWVPMPPSVTESPPWGPGPVRPRRYFRSEYRPVPVPLARPDQTYTRVNIGTPQNIARNASPRSFAINSDISVVPDFSPISHDEEARRNRYLSPGVSDPSDDSSRGTRRIVNVNAPYFQDIPFQRQFQDSTSYLDFNLPYRAYRPVCNEVRNLPIRVERPTTNIRGNLRRSQSARDPLHVDPLPQPSPPPLPRPMSAPIPSPTHVSQPGLLIPTIYEQLWLDVD
jgi:hypothetical protein